MIARKDTVRTTLCAAIMTVGLMVCCHAQNPSHPAPPAGSQDLRDAVSLPPAFPPGDYTPHGYIDNPFHSMILNRSGVIRSVPPAGFGWWRAEFKGAYGGGDRDHVNYVSLLQMSVAVDGVLLADTRDFREHGINITSKYHSKSMVSFDWTQRGVDVSLKYFLPREHTLACFVELSNTNTERKEVTLFPTHIYGIGDVKWWGSDGLSARYDEELDISVSKVWAYGDVFVLGATLKSDAHFSTDSLAEWKAWLSAKGSASRNSSSIRGRGPLRIVHSCRVVLPPKSGLRALVCLSRGKNEEWAREEYMHGSKEALSNLRQQLADDQAFWSACPVLDGDWPVSWKRGWVYDFETLRMNVRRPIGVFKHPWDAMQIHSPRVVLGETSLDMMTLGYANPDLAKEVIEGTFADALAPNIPCVREDGSMNMISSDGSECGTAPMWGFPFHVIRALYRSTHDDAWITRLYPYLKAYLEWWLTNRTDKEGWLHCNNSWESGQDGSKRFLVAEGNEGAVADFVRTVDVEASVAEATTIMEEFSVIAGKPDDAKEWKRLADRRVQNTRAMFFEGSFRDIDGRTSTPIILKNYYDVMMLSPLACDVATPEQTEAMKHLIRRFQDGKERWLEWPPGIFTFIEAAWNASEPGIAADVVGRTADRVYQRTDARDVLYDDGPLAYRVPGVANEFWPVRAIPAGGENYGWGATLPMAIIRSIIGFREHASSNDQEFSLTPSIPDSLRSRGAAFGINHLHFRGMTFDVRYTFHENNGLTVSFSYDATTPIRWRIVDPGGGEMARQDETKSKGTITFRGKNGETYRVQYNETRSN
jgi:hypothetical protein